MPPKRKRADAEDGTSQGLQRTRSAVDEAVAEFVCPITQSLPVDPVMAEDGMVYERSAIEKWIKKHKRSPLTNEAVGTKLLPALQVKNMIRSMVKSGALAGEKVDACKERLAEEEEVAEERRKAEAGDRGAMYMLGIWYQRGQKGLAKDEAKAFEWFTRSHEAGDAIGTSLLGTCYLYGGGIEPSHTTAVSLYTEAALGGSKGACGRLGTCYAKGINGFPKDLKLARRWYSMVATASFPDLDDDGIEQAAAWLRDHPA